jgi:nitric oxide reductase large subunit
VGAFTFMGVLGANIMKNKSRTQRITPEFVYVPWVFAGVLWILCGILMGMLLRAIPPQFEAKRAALSAIHSHSILVGGFLMLAMGLMTRLVPLDQGRPPPRFDQVKWSFYGLNIALGLFAVGKLADDGTWWTAAASVSILLAVAGWFMTLRPNDAGGRPA